MSETLTLPVLPLEDGVVLPGMVVPLDLSESGEVRAAIEAARAVAQSKGPGIRSAAKPRVLLVPRLNGQYAAVGTLGVIEQEGRLPGGEPGAVVRGVQRVRIGTGTTGPGAALWVEGTQIETPPRPGAPRSWRRSTRAWSARSCRSGARGRSWTWSSGSTTRRRWPTTPGTRRT